MSDEFGEERPDSGLVTGIGSAIVDAESDPGVRGVVLTGTGDRAFCARMDLRSFAAGDAPGTGDDEGAAGFLRLVRGEVAVPIVGAANGSAVAGGFRAAARLRHRGRILGDAVRARVDEAVT